MSGGARNHVIDLARALSVLVVVVFHTLLYRIVLTEAGPTLVPWAAPTWLYPLTWVLMIMPLFFVAGGFAHALTIDRMRREGSSAGHYLASRGRRLIGPLSVFVTFCAIVFSLAAWAGRLDAASELSRLLMQLLWFITTYLGIVVIAPGAVRAHDRFGVAPMIALALLAAGVDAWSFAVDHADVRYANLLFVWPLVHQFGIAYQRGWWRRGPVWVAWASVVVGAGLVALLVVGFGYPPSAVGFADLPIANIQPPTLAMAGLALAQCGVLGLVERSGVLAGLPPRVEGALAVLNAVMVSVYLWHIPLIGLAGGVLALVAVMVPGTAPVLLSPAVLALASLALVAAAVPLLGQLELRMIPPLGPRQDTTLAVLAYGMLGFGTLLVWLTGTVVHPGRPGSTLGVLAIWVGSWTMGRAADRSQAVTRG